MSRVTMRYTVLRGMSVESARIADKVKASLHADQIRARVGQPDEFGNFWVAIELEASRAVEVLARMDAESFWEVALEDVGDSWQGVLGDTPEFVFPGEENW